MTAREHDHLDPEFLVEFERASLDELTRAGALAHLERCGRCRAELELVRQYFSIEEGAQLADGRSSRLRAAFQERLHEQDRVQDREQDNATGSESPTRSPRAARRMTPRRGAWSLLVAASLALILVASSQLWESLRFSPDEGELRATESAQWAAQLQLQRLDDGGLELDWPEWAGVESYRVLLLDSRGATVFEDETSASCFKVESSALSRLSPDELYFAVVALTQLSGGTLRSSPRALPPE